MGMNQKFPHLRISLRMLKNGNQKDPQLLIEPNDSISNVSKSSRVSMSSKSRSSTSATSARLKVVTERAALLARAAALKEKHALEMEKVQLNTRLEQMELEMNLAESNAKLKVLETFEYQNEHNLLTSVPQNQHEDNMKEYLTTYQEAADVTASREASAVGSSAWKNLGAIPKTPLQRYLNQQSIPLANSLQQNKSTRITQQQYGPAVKSPPRTQAGGGFNMANTDDTILTVMQRQNDIANLLALQHKQVSLPACEIPV